MPVEPDGGTGDGAGPIPETTGGGTIEGTRGGDTLKGTDGDDLIKGRKGDDTLTTGMDTVRGGKGDDTITVDGPGDRKIDGGKGSDTVVLKGTADDYAATANADGSTVYTADDGSEISVRSVETTVFADGPPPASDFTAFYGLAPNDIGATTLDVTGNTATLIGPDTDFTFTGIDPSGLAADGPLIATGGSGTIDGVETTAVAGAGSDIVLQVTSGFNPTGTQGVFARFENGQVLDTTVAGVSAP